MLNHPALLVKFWGFSPPAFASFMCVQSTTPNTLGKFAIAENLSKFLWTSACVTGRLIKSRIFFSRPSDTWSTKPVLQKLFLLGRHFLRASSLMVFSHWARPRTISVARPMKWPKVANHIVYFWTFHRSRYKNRSRSRSVWKDHYVWRIAEILVMSCFRPVSNTKVENINLQPSSRLKRSL